MRHAPCEAQHRRWWNEQAGVQHNSVSKCFGADSWFEAPGDKVGLKIWVIRGNPGTMSIRKTSWTALMNVPFTSLPSLPSLGHSPRSKLVSLDKVFYHTELTTQLICGLVGWDTGLRPISVCPLTSGPQDMLCLTNPHRTRLSPDVPLPPFLPLSYTTLWYRGIIRNILLIFVPGSWHRDPKTLGISWVMGWEKHLLLFIISLF